MRFNKPAQIIRVLTNVEFKTLVEGRRDGVGRRRNLVVLGEAEQGKEMGRLAGDLRKIDPEKEGHVTIRAMFIPILP